MAAATVVKFDVTSNSKNSRKELEREAVDSFHELERAERAAGIPELGKRFGYKIINTWFSVCGTDCEMGTVLWIEGLAWKNAPAC